MSIYIPKLQELPQHQMARLAPEARFSMIQSSGFVSDYVYEWDDLKITINVMPHAEVAAHLEEFVGWSRSVARAQGQPLDEVLVRRIRSSSMVLGVIVEGTTDREVWHERTQDLIAMICFHTSALLFWEGLIYDKNCQQLLP
jgi:hypothetical protein